MYRSLLSCSSSGSAAAQNHRFLPFLLLLLCSFQPLAAQKLPVGRVREESVKVGDTLHYALSYRHSGKLDVLFPDTTFKPGGQLEILRKQFFPTRTLNNTSLDSAIYTMRSFEVMERVPVQIPVLVFEGDDTIQKLPKPVFVITERLLKQAPDKLLLKSEDKLIPIKPAFNYLYLVSGLVLIVVLSLLTFLVFGKRIKRAYRLYVLQKEFRSFQNRFNSLVRRFARLESVPVMEEAIVLWKNYLTELEDHPINSYTTTEIATYYNQDAISKALKLCDRAIYGNIVANQRQEASSALLVLLNFASVRYDDFKTNLRGEA
jgi:hypothetical protein